MGSKSCTVMKCLVDVDHGERGGHFGQPRQNEAEKHCNTVDLQDKRGKTSDRPSLKFRTTLSRGP